MSNPQNTSIQYLKALAQRGLKVFSLGNNTIYDLFYYFPKRYEDRSNYVKISELKKGELSTIQAKVLSLKDRSSWRKRGFNITEAEVMDNTGKVSCVWFNQPYIKRYLKPGKDMVLYGKVELYAGRLQFSNPEFEFVGEDSKDSLSLGRIVPVYALPEGMGQRSFRKLVKFALDEYLPKLSDSIPYDIRSRNDLENLPKSLLNIHFPESFALQERSYRRLAFEEFFLFQVPLALRKLKREEKSGISHKVDELLLRSFIAALPFRFTRAQEKVLEEIRNDMFSSKPMQRLLQGDVGSGKTIVAATAAFIAIAGGYQAALMAPTEILARQHYESIRSYLKKEGVFLLTGSLTQKERGDILKKLAEGKIDLIIGTHALLEDKVVFKNLGLVVIDEQHKFGVGQRALLPDKGKNPDVLIMTATPIPRTLAITIYGDLDISVINESPPGRAGCKTMLFNQTQRDSAYSIVIEELKKGNQAYIIYPVIEESLALDILGAKKMYLQLRAGFFKEFRLGLVHGKLPQKEQEKVMADFKDKKIDLLVSTTVLEVGIDIHTATCMVIENAGRFGLSQLHQLRGRVGRGSKQAYCLLISDSDSQDVNYRLSAMVKYGDGFSISEEDLKIRGPGEFFGKNQHGLSDLKIGDPLAQMQLLKKAREEAIRLLRLDPALTLKHNLLLKERLILRFPEYEQLILVG